MRSLRAFRYSVVFLHPIMVSIAFVAHGIWTWLPIFFAFVVIPTIELFLSPRPENLNEENRKSIAGDRTYDLLLYVIVPIQWAMLIWFLFSISEPNLGWVSLFGRIFSMGLLCGTLGINVAHELGHRSRRGERALAKVLLLTSLYMHFYIEHNRGHHKNVSTYEDPSSARINEPLQVFWFRSIFMGFISAWRLEYQRLDRKGFPFLSIRNEMIRFQIIQLALLAAIWIIFGPKVLLAFLLAALIGILLLETVNYIEHYGLVRRKDRVNRYESAKPIHSWNSDHPLGRMALFELSRHSDHHYRASKPYPLLDHHDDSPQMPTGYPGMMIISQIPPLWFRIMNPRVRSFMGSE